MISEEFKRDLKGLLNSSMKDALAEGGQGDRWQVRDTDREAKIAFEEFYMLSISSPLFRIAILMHFTKSDHMRQYVSSILNINISNLEDEKFYDYMGEVGNVFVGAIKRDLARAVPSLGMSTPNRLTEACLTYVSALKVDYETHVKVSLDDNPAMHASLFLSAYGDLDFKMPSRQILEDEVDSGELEFF